MRVTEVKPRNELPLISIITIAYNASSYVEKTLESVVSQTYPNIEYIIIDGGSTDGTVEIIKKYSGKISKLISEPDKGIYDAMNKGLSFATGDWVNFLNGGDSYHDSETLSNIFRDSNLHQDIQFIYGDSINVKGGSTKYIKAVNLSMQILRRGSSVCHQTVFVRRKLAPHYDLTYKYKAEYNWIIDILQSIPQTAVSYQPFPIVYYPLGGFSEKGMLKNLKEFMQVTIRRFGLIQFVKNLPLYLFIFLRYLKYTIFP